MIRVLLVDDQPTVLQGLRMRLGLESDLVVIGEAEDGQAAIDLVSARSPDVIVLDLEMPGMDGIATAQALRAIAPEGAVIILSIHSDIGRAEARPGSRRGGIYREECRDRAFVGSHSSGTSWCVVHITGVRSHVRC